MDLKPLVSIGVPVRNGAPFLDEALLLLRQQTYAHLEIIISDNASDDGSSEIIQRHAAEDNRIRVYRQEQVVTALANFRFVFEQASANFFMWAACDDRRSLDYVEHMLGALIAHPEASLSFGNLADFSDLNQWRNAPVIPHDFETNPKQLWHERVLWITRSKGHHIYGLIRTSALRSYEWLDIIDVHNDAPLNVHLVLSGELVRANGGCFYYYRPEVKKTHEASSLMNNLRPPKSFPELRMAWACAHAIQRGRAVKGEYVFLPWAFVLVFANRQWGWIKPLIFESTPKPLIGIYRKWFKRART